MHTSSLFARLFPVYVFVGLAALAAAGYYGLRTVSSASRDRMARELETQTRLAAAAVEHAVRNRAYDNVQAFCQTRRSQSRFHVSVMLPDGTVIGDSHDAVENIGNQANRPEVAEAIERGDGSAARFDPLTRDDMQYYAVTIVRPPETLAVVRAGLSRSAMGPSAGGFGVALTAGALIVLALSATAGVYVSRDIRAGTEPVRDAADQSLKLNRATAASEGTPEAFAPLANAADTMTAKLWRTASELDAQRHQQEAVLASMIECVLAVDGDERVITINRAARDLFGMQQSDVEGRPVYEVLRNPDLQQLISDTLERDEAIEREFVVPLPERRVVQARGTLLPLDSPEHGGVVVVLHDITSLRGLEEARREFVANVSHELRTPITSITGFVETLLDGAIREPDQAESFLNIVLRQTERLNAIIDDLLSLSRIEQGGLARSGLLNRTSVCAVLEKATQVCAAEAADRGVRLEIECDATEDALMHEELITQAVSNLVQNAVKYSEPGGRVLVRGSREGEALIVAVSDSGSGIEAQHLPRLFERFYRVDRARSRELGGTGLGLAIVKHIAQAHGGTVDVTSTFGEGSTFRIRIPAGSA